MENPFVSLVIPFLNEEPNLPILLNELEQYSKDLDFWLEVVFVDDGSSDRSCEIINSANPKNFSAKLVRLSRNYGSHAAIRAGILHASAPNCTFIGADLQEPLEMVTRMVSKMREGYDIVCVQKHNVEAGFATRMFTRIYTSLVRKYAVPGFPSGNVNNILINEKVKEQLNRHIECNSSVSLQIINMGYRQALIDCDFQARMHGKSKWTLGKKIKLFIDSFVAFSFMPIRLVSIVGIIMAILGFLFGLAIVINKLVNPLAVIEGYATLAALILFSSGVTNISLGIIAEYLWRAYDASRKRPPFVVSDVQQIK